MVKTFDEAEKYIDSFIRPTTFARFEADKHLTDPLERMRYLLEVLGNPQDSFPAVQVSGTSGKGSTSYLISHILCTAGYTVGYTLSPHLQKINERIQVNNVPITDDDLVVLVNEITPEIKKMSDEWIGPPSRFEILLALALLYFKKNKVNIVVAEVGLEGRFDGTNSLHPVLGVLTNISLDHTSILGDTIEKIATEASSLIKEKEMTVVTAVTQPSVKKIVKGKANSVGASVTWCTKDQVFESSSTKKGSVFSLKLRSGTLFSQLSLSLVGSYQLENATLALEAIDTLEKKGFHVEGSALREALKTAEFPGRFQILPAMSSMPEVILDGAHNPEKMRSFIHDLQTLYPHQKKIFIVAFKESKKIDDMLRSIADVADGIIVTQFQMVTDLKNFAMPLETILDTLNEIKDIPVHQRSKSSDALELGKKKARVVDGVLVITGSLYLVGEMMTLLGI